MIGLVCFNFPQFRATVIAADSFLDAFQRVADVANSSRGKGTVLSGTFSCLPRQISTLRYLRLVLQQNKSGVNIASKADFLGRLYFLQ